jgi:hypothetical protein
MYMYRCESDLLINHIILGTNFNLNICVNVLFKNDIQCTCTFLYIMYTCIYLNVCPSNGLMKGLSPCCNVLINISWHEHQMGQDGFVHIEQV